MDDVVSLERAVPARNVARSVDAKRRCLCNAAVSLYRSSKSSCTVSCNKVIMSVLANIDIITGCAIITSWWCLHIQRARYARLMCALCQ